MATYDAETKEIKYDTYDNKVEYYYEGTMLNFKSKYSNALVTPNHKMLINQWWH